MTKIGARYAVAQAGLRAALIVAATLAVACGDEPAGDDTMTLDAGPDAAEPPDAGGDPTDSGGPDASPAPRTITAKQIAVDYRRACALREGGALTCWGSPLPSGVAPPTPPPVLSTLAAPMVGHVCGLDAEGSPHCWGGNTDRESEPPSGLKLKRVSIGASFSCGLTQDGSIRCWGREPAGLPQGTGYTELAASANGVCALKSGGEIACSTGEIMPPDGQFAQLVAFGTNHCALRDTGAVVCWPNLTQVPADERFVQVSVGVVRGCGLRADGSATCWSTPFAAPQQPPLNETFSAVQCGETFTCGIRKADSRVLCWGVSPEGVTDVPLAD